MFSTNFYHINCHPWYSVYCIVYVHTGNNFLFIFRVSEGRTLTVCVLLALSCAIELSVNLCKHGFSWTGHWCRHLLHRERTAEWKVPIVYVWKLKVNWFNLEKWAPLYYGSRCDPFCRFVSFLLLIGHCVRSHEKTFVKDRLLQVY